MYADGSISPFVVRLYPPLHLYPPLSSFVLSPFIPLCIYIPLYPPLYASISPFVARLLFGLVRGGFGQIWSTYLISRENNLRNFETM
jgi:hypothetical protein